mmetsp:Transcript_139305/g.362180  ORF Transcript_139305/g.362180 Transcript_139305/m.362180 type:complete len:344 (+) Transcript_139305:2301-3332(+)
MASQVLQALAAHGDVGTVLLRHVDRHLDLAPLLGRPHEAWRALPAALRGEEVALGEGVGVLAGEPAPRRYPEQLPQRVDVAKGAVRQGGRPSEGREAVHLTRLTREHVGAVGEVESAEVLVFEGWRRAGDEGRAAVEEVDRFAAREGVRRASAECASAVAFHALDLGPLVDRGVDFSIALDVTTWILVEQRLRRVDVGAGADREAGEVGSDRDPRLLATDLATCAGADVRALRPVQGAVLGGLGWDDAGHEGVAVREDEDGLAGEVRGALRVGSAHVARRAPPLAKFVLLETLGPGVGVLALDVALGHLPDQLRRRVRVLRRAQRLRHAADVGLLAGHVARAA